MSSTAVTQTTVTPRHSSTRRGRFTLIAVLVGLLLLVAAIPGWSQATWEGPTGVFFNPLALTLPAGTSQASVHYLDLSGSGSLTTLSYTAGLAHGLEAGVAHIGLAVGGSSNSNSVFGKWVALPAKGDAPAVAVGTTWRFPESGDDANGDAYVAITKIFPARTPIIASLTVRATNGLWSGLFGKANNWTTQVGGFLGVVATPKLIVGGEYYEQPDSDAWKDVAVRYTASSSTNVDLGWAHLSDTFDNQYAVAVSSRW